MINRPVTLSLLIVGLGMQAVAQSYTSQSVRTQFASVNRKILTMAKDFPEDKYNFKLKPEMRSLPR